MDNLIHVVIGIVAALHLYILWLEMFAWKSRGPKVFKSVPPELFPKTKSLAANQGLYNGFLAAGLIWTFFIREPLWHDRVALFFLACIGAAGIYGALTADRKIFFVQGLPALIGILMILLRWPAS
jgi:putative membrane protein